MKRVEVRWDKGAFEWYYLCRTCPDFSFGHAEWTHAMDAVRKHLVKSHQVTP